MENASESCRHESHIPKIIYFAAIAEPSAKQKFDGRLLFKPLLRQRNAKQKASLWPDGTPMLEPISMDRKKFNEVIIEMITSVVTKIPSFERIRIIDDDAGGHSVVKGIHDALNKSLTDTRKWITENSAPEKFLYGYEIYFLLQPVQSPHLNTLDLGFHGGLWR